MRTLILRILAHPRLCIGLLAALLALSGLALTRRDDFLRWNSVSAGSPMPYGESFLLKRT